MHLAIRPIPCMIGQVHLVLGNIEKLRCRYDMRKISRYSDIHDISCMVLFRNNICLHALPFLIYILIFK